MFNRSLQRFLRASPFSRSLPLSMTLRMFTCAFPSLGFRFRFRPVLGAGGGTTQLARQAVRLLRAMEVPKSCSWQTGKQAGPILHLDALFPDFRTSPALKSQLAYIQSFKFFKQVSWVSQREILFILCRCLCAEKRTKVGRYPSRSLTKAVESIRSSIRSGAAITCMKWIGFSVKVSNGSPTA